MTEPTMSGMISAFDGHTPQIHASVFVDIAARVIGRVSLV